MLKETSYYQYVKGVNPRDLLSFETSLYSYLYGLFEDLSKYSLELYDLFDVSKKISLIKIFSTLLQLISRRDYETLKKVLELAPAEVRRIFDEYIREETSLSRVLEDLMRRNIIYTSLYYRDLSKILSHDLALVISSDLAQISLLSRLASSYPEIADMVCREIDLSMINFFSKVISRKLQDKFASLLNRIAEYSCSLSRALIEEMLASDEVRFLGVLRRVFPPSIVAQDMLTSSINIRWYLRKLVKERANSAMYSYPYTYATPWAVSTIKRYDIEDLVSILISKIGLISIDSIKRYTTL